MGQIADRHLGLADVEQDQRLDAVDVVPPEPVKLKLDDVQEATVQPLDQPHRLQVYGLARLVHPVAPPCSGFIRSADHIDDP
jgi:hypothetical protein